MLLRCVNECPRYADSHIRAASPCFKYEDSHKFETPLGVVSFIFTIFRFSYISKRKMVFFIWININFLLSIELIVESLTPSAACSRAEK